MKLIMIEKGLLKGSIKTIILKLLDENGKMYGYEISQRVKELSQDEILLTEGALYPMLHKMEADGLLSIEKVMVGKRVRKYYSLTPKGTSETVQKLREFQDFVATMQWILKPKTNLGSL